jgi:surface antigen
LPVRAGWTHRHKRLWRGGLVAANIAVLAVIITLVLANQHTTINSNAAPVSDSSVAKTVANPLDQLSSADIAQTVAQVNSLPETTAITNQAQSQAANIAIASTSNNVIAKPQVVTASLQSPADIKTYVTKPGDTVAGLAAKFGVTSDSIRWSNNLSATDSLNPGTSLLIPPVNGVIYIVRPGDTAASLAVQFGANADQITAYNDGEVHGFTAGRRIIIPGATHNNSGATASSIAATTGAAGNGGFLWGAGPIYGYNGYDYGYCTWYVATQVPVPANWGNASTWAYYASLSGWHVSTAPSVGSIAQTAAAAGGEGHVAIVTAVNPDGSIQVRDMNGIAGWGRVGYGNKSASAFQHYISR